MSNSEGRVVAAIQYSTTSEPVVFAVDSDRVAGVVEALPEDFRSMYVTAWRDAIAAVMDDCGWSYDAGSVGNDVHVERVRTGRPRVIHGAHIESQLARAVKAVDDALDSVVAAHPELVVSIAEARAAQPIAFDWRITESFIPLDGSPERTMQLLGSSYIDLTTKPTVRI